MAEERNDDLESPNDGDPGSANVASGNGQTVDGYTVFDPAGIRSGGESGGADAPKRKRGRPAGSGNGGASAKRTQAQKASTAVGGIEKTLLSIHTMLALGFEAPEMALAPEDARLLSEAIVDVGEQYSLSVDPKMAAWGKLTVVMLGIYGGRFMRIAARKKMERKPEVIRPSSAEVFNFSPGSGVMPPQ